MTKHCIPPNLPSFLPASFLPRPHHVPWPQAVDAFVALLTSGCRRLPWPSRDFLPTSFHPTFHFPLIFQAVDAFMAMTKEYSGTLRLGEATPSYDAESEVDERVPWEHITDEAMLAAREGLMGEIQQLPPMYSAVKVGGQRLYLAARKGKEVERPPRTITVERFDLWRDEADAQNVHFRIVCSKGTYIRSLAADLGRALGSAAHLTALRREAIGGYNVEGAWEVQQLAAQLTEQRQAQQEQRRQAAEGSGTAAAEAAVAESAQQAGVHAPGQQQAVAEQGV